MYEIAISENRAEQIRSFIIRNLHSHPKDITRLTSEEFEVSRQAVNKHLQKLVLEGLIVSTGTTRNRSYMKRAKNSFLKEYAITASLAEDQVWSQDISVFLGTLPKNINDIWNYAFTEMFNNAIDHSDGTQITVNVKKGTKKTEMMIHDDGVGIFKKIQTALNLLDESHAVFELAKGKLTTDPSRHTGEGIFFTSRMMDSFSIMSGEVYLNHEYEKPEDWVMEMKQTPGTTVFMELDNLSLREDKKVFDEYVSGDDYGFTKTVVPVELAQYGSDKLISRSQAKRLLARIELFETVLFDFKGVAEIGQAFADEIFRVFAGQHPTIKLHAINATKEVDQMVSRARFNAAQMAQVPQAPKEGK